MCVSPRKKGEKRRLLFILPLYVTIMDKMNAIGILFRKDTQILHSHTHRARHRQVEL